LIQRFASTSHENVSITID
jgi:signal transduction histidine kinase